MFFISIKEINWLISKEKSNTYLLRTTGCSQNFDFLGKKIWRDIIALKSKDVP